MRDRVVDRLFGRRDRLFDQLPSLQDRPTRDRQRHEQCLGNRAGGGNRMGALLNTYPVNS